MKDPLAAINDVWRTGESWIELRRLIKLHGHEKLISALRYDQMVQILGEVPEPAAKPATNQLPDQVTSKKD